jgi:hypothetical protein
VESIRLRWANIADWEDELELAEIEENEYIWVYNFRVGLMLCI